MFLCSFFYVRNKDHTTVTCQCVEELQVHDKQLIHMYIKLYWWSLPEWWQLLDDGYYLMITTFEMMITFIMKTTVKMMTSIKWCTFLENGYYILNAYLKKMITTYKTITAFIMKASFELMIAFIMKIATDLWPQLNNVYYQMMTSSETMTIFKWWQLLINNHF